MQKEAKENPGTPSDAGSKQHSTSNSAANSEPGSPRLTLSPRLPSLSNNNSNSARAQVSSVDKWRLRIQRPDVSKSLPHTPGHDADQSEPTSPTGSVASVASTASETALIHRRTGLLQPMSCYKLPNALVKECCCSISVRQASTALCSTGADTSGTPQSHASAARTPASSAPTMPGASAVLRRSMDTASSSRLLQSPLGPVCLLCSAVCYLANFPIRLDICVCSFGPVMHTDRLLS